MVDTKETDWICDMFSYYGGLDCLSTIFQSTKLSRKEKEDLRKHILKYIETIFMY